MSAGNESPVRPGVEANVIATRVPEVSFQEVRRLVAPEGACKNLDSIRISGQSVQEGIHTFVEDHLTDDRRKEALAPIINRAEGKSSDLKQVLIDALQNTEFLRAVTLLPEGESLSRTTIKQTLNLANIPIIERVDAVLNQGIDPEMIPLASKTMYGAEVPDDIVQALTRDEFLRQRLTTILSNSNYISQFHLPDFNGGAQYSQDLMHEINGFINSCVYNIGQTRDATKEQLGSARMYLDHFFMPDVATRSSGVVTEFYQTLRSRTLGHYFEYKQRSPYALNLEERERWIGLSGTGSTDLMGSFLKAHGEAADKGRYLVMLFNMTKDIYQDAFPEIYVDPKVKQLKLIDPLSGRDGTQEPSEGLNEANGSFSPLHNSITIKAGTLVQRGGLEAFDEQTFSMLGQPMRRKTAEAVTMAHEFTHAIFQNVVHGGMQREQERKDYQASADHAINEGLAVTMEFLFIDHLKIHPELLNLDQRDIADLENWKTRRLYQLKKDRNGYTEGTFWILHHIYVEGAGERDQRDVHAGLVAVRNFMNSLDSQKTMQVTREDPKYKDLLKSNNPSEWIKFFSAGGNKGTELEPNPG